MVPPLKIICRRPDSLPQAGPLYGNAVTAGFPSPADDHVERDLDLNEHLVPAGPAAWTVGRSICSNGVSPSSSLAAYSKATCCCDISPTLCCLRTSARILDGLLPSPEIQLPAESLPYY